MAPLQVTTAILVTDHRVTWEQHSADKTAFKIKSYTLQVPVGYDDDSRWWGHYLQLQCNVVCGRENDGKDVGIEELATKKRGLVLYLCGGPGSENPAAECDAINNYFLDMGFYPFYMDYRGCGQSTPFTRASMNAFTGPEEAADYLTNFNFRDIARDFEAARRWASDKAGQNIKWHALGQSYGGWIAYSGVSYYPDGWEHVMTSGGTPPVFRGPDEVYLETYQSVIRRNDEFYDAYPQARRMVKELVRFLHVDRGDGLALPGGGRLTAQRFMGLGRGFGRAGGLAEVYGLVAKMHRELRSEGFRDFEDATLEALVASSIKYDTRPLYAVLHEAIYCSGRASHWSAARVGLTRFADKYWWVGDEGFRGCNLEFEGQLYFSGEHVFPWVFDAYAGLGDDLKEVANILARHEWPPGFDEEQLTEKNQVRITSIVFEKDMYVSPRLSRETSGNIPCLESIWDSEHFHAAIKDPENGPDVLQQLLGFGGREASQFQESALGELQRRTGTVGSPRAKRSN